MHVRESNDGLLVTYINSADLGPQNPLEVHLRVSLWRLWHSISLFLFCYYSLVCNIGALHMETITAGSFLQEKWGIEVITLCPAYFSLKPPVFQEEAGLHTPPDIQLCYSEARAICCLQIKNHLCSYYPSQRSSTQLCVTLWRASSPLDSASPWRTGKWTHAHLDSIS